jgi:hypothetical protein
MTAPHGEVLAADRHKPCEPQQEADAGAKKHEALRPREVRRIGA